MRKQKRKEYKGKQKVPKREDSKAPNTPTPYDLDSLHKGRIQKHLLHQRWHISMKNAYEKPANPERTPPTTPK